MAATVEKVLSEKNLADRKSAIKTIESKIEDMDETALRTLGDFITGINNKTPQIKFLYYDMDNRTNGEETFVVINTTGEPLSANQNLTPLVINLYKHHMPDIENKWEEMETGFWRHRDKAPYLRRRHV